MGLVEIILLAVALAMDCFVVSVATGIIQKRVVRGSMLAMALLFGLFQAAMPLAGWLCVNHFNHYIQPFDHWIAFALLTFIGGKMVWDGLKGEEAQTFNPNSFRVILLLAVATSIDALAVGVSFACLNMNTLQSILLPIGIIGFVAFAFSVAGLAIGILLGKKFNWPVEIIGGIILIIIGVKVLVEHLS